MASQAMSIPQPSSTSQSLADFQVVKCEKDGNCLFRFVSIIRLACYVSPIRAIAKGMGIGEEAHALLRSSTATYLQKQRSRFEGILDLDIPWEDYIQRLKRDGEWAGEPIIVLISELYSVQIIVHIQEDDSIQHSYGSPKSPCTIHLLFSHRNHYDLLVPRSDSSQHVVENREEESLLSTTSSSDSSSSEVQNSTDSDTSPEETYSEDDHIAESGVSPLSRQTVEEILFTQVPPPASAVTPSSTSDDELTLTGLLQTHLKNEDTCREWMREMGLLPKTLKCDHCGKSMVFHSPTIEHKDGSFFCSACHKRKSPRSGTIFSRSHLSLNTLLQIMIRWFQNDSTRTIKRECRVTYRTISKVREMMIAFCTQYMLKRSEKIGGPGRVVEVDECLLHRRKHHVGRGKDPGWVLGGVERPRSLGEIPRMFLVACANRKRDTLQQHLSRFVEKGTVLVTDSFSSYKGLSSLGYHHYTVNHKIHFVSPDTRAHTQRIEGVWRHVRRSALPLTGCKLSDVGFYLSAYQYRRRRHRIEEFLEDIKHCEVAELDTLKLRRRALFLSNQQTKCRVPPSPTPKPTTHPKSRKQRLQRSANDTEGRRILRETEFSNIRNISQQKHSNKIATVRETAQTVQFDVVANAELCLKELNDSKEVVPHKPSPTPTPKRRRIQTVSSIRTRSSTRSCAGRVPGFYTNRLKKSQK